MRLPDGSLAVSAAAMDAVLLAAVHDLAAELTEIRARLVRLERARRA